MPKGALVSSEMALICLFVMASFFARARALCPRLSLNGHCANNS
jgi:hypothetical protein